MYVVWATEHTTNTTQFVSEGWEISALEEMKKAGEEEIALARQRGDVDKYNWDVYKRQLQEGVPIPPLLLPPPNPTALVSLNPQDVQLYLSISFDTTANLPDCHIKKD